MHLGKVWVQNAVVGWHSLWYINVNGRLGVTGFKFEATHVPFSRRKFPHKMKNVKDVGRVSTLPAVGAVHEPALHLHALLCGSPAS